LWANPVLNQTWTQPAGELGTLAGAFVFAGPSLRLDWLIGNDGCLAASNGYIVPTGNPCGTGGGGGGGAVTSVATGQGLTGGPINASNPSGTIYVTTGGITNVLIANPQVTVTAGTGLSGGGTVALGGAITLNSTGVAPTGTIGTPFIGQGSGIPSTYIGPPVSWTPVMNWTQTQTGVTWAAGVQQTITLTPCPLGIDTSNSYAQGVLIYLTSPLTDPNEEVATVTGGSACSSGSMTIVFIPALAHSGNVTLASATAGMDGEIVPRLGISGNCALQAGVSNRGIAAMRW
jgi:hypothetical protein